MRFKVYNNAREEYRWRLVTANGQIIADSGEGYGRRANGLAGIQLIKVHDPGAPIVG